MNRENFIAYKINRENFIALQKDVKLSIYQRVYLEIKKNY